MFWEWEWKDGKLLRQEFFTSDTIISGKKTYSTSFLISIPFSRNTLPYVDFRTLESIRFRRAVKRSVRVFNYTKQFHALKPKIKMKKKNKKNDNLVRIRTVCRTWLPWTREIKKRKYDISTCEKTYYVLPDAMLLKLFALQLLILHRKQNCLFQ